MFKIRSLSSLERFFYPLSNYVQMPRVFHFVNKYYYKICKRNFNIYIIYKKKHKVLLLKSHLNRKISFSNVPEIWNTPFRCWQLEIENSKRSVARRRRAKRPTMITTTPNGRRKRDRRVHLSYKYLCDSARAYVCCSPRRAPRSAARSTTAFLDRVLTDLNSELNSFKD